MAHGATMAMEAAQTASNERGLSTDLEIGLSAKRPAASEAAAGGIIATAAGSTGSTGSVSLLFTADLQLAVVSLPPKMMPATCWVRLSSRGKSGPEAGPIATLPAWLLTPLTLARILYQAYRLDEAFARGQYPRDRIDDVAGRVARILRHVATHWTEADRTSASDELSRLERSGGPKDRLPMPEPIGEWTPWDGREDPRDTAKRRRSEAAAAAAAKAAKAAKGR